MLPVSFDKIDYNNIIIMMKTTDILSDHLVAIVILLNSQ